MSWGFGGLAANVPRSNGSSANAGSDLEAVETEQLGFQALAGERKIRLCPSPWSSDSPPSKTASLLSIANGRKILAAAGPDALNLFDTEAIRTAFSEPGDEKIKDIQAKVSVSVPRLSQLAFTSDENALIITAEQGGGLAVYETNAAGPSWSPAFQIPTENTAVRHLLPNPNPDTSHVVAVVLEDGKLLIADLKSKAFASGSNGIVLKENVSCASWSKKGKQIVVGLADGTAVQLDTQGNIKDSLPRPPSTTDLPVTAIYWLENLEFLVVHSPTANQADDNDAMSAMTEVFYHLVLRSKDTNVCSFHRFLVDPCPPFMDNRLPPHHYIQRIRDWQPNLDDTLVIACSASTDIGTFTRSKVALSQDLPSDQISHTYTTTSFTDTRRAALPLAANDMGDTYPIGFVIDLSSSQMVKKPIPNDETLDESAIPLPELCVLNQEGILSAWWYVYNEAVRAKQAAPGMSTSTTVVSTSGSTAATNPPFSQASLTPSVSAFTQAASSQFAQSTQTPPGPAFGQPAASAFGQPSQIPAKPSFGQPSQTPAKPAFGQASTPQFGQSGGPTFGATSTPGFGAPSGLGSTASPWATKTDQTAPTTTSTFGAPSSLGISAASTAFGQTGGMSFGKPSVWGTSSPATSSSQTGSTFGQPSTPFGVAKAAESPFAAFAKQHREQDGKAAVSPFAGFAQSNTGKSPFASFTSPANKQLSPFAAQAKPGMPSETSFGSTVTLSSNNGSFGSGSTFGPSRFGQPSETAQTTTSSSAEKTSDPPGLKGLSGFKLGSTFEGDGSSKNDLPKPDNPGQGLFGSAFGKSLSDTTQQHSASQPIIKEEPREISLKDIPEASPVQEPRAEPAPLPPDFTMKPKPVDDAPLPPDFVTKPEAESNNAALALPLPPHSLPTGPETHADAADLPQSPTSESQQNESDEQDDEREGLPVRDDEDPQDWEGVSDEDEEEDEEDASEGEQEDDDDEDDAEEGDWEEASGDDDEENHTPQIINPERLSAFTSRITPASPKTTDKSRESTTPETLKKPSFTPAGFPKVSVAFPPPQAIQESPRSPSPVRAVTSPMHLPQQKTTPAVSQIAVTKLGVSNGKASLFQPRSTPPSPAPVESLEDHEDANTKQILAAPIEPSIALPEFVAHQDYTGKSSKEGIAGQLECVYRDVNSMIDTLGLNARALQAFVAGHGAASEGLSVDSLENIKDWKIGDIYALGKVQVTIDDDLEGGKLTDIAGKVEEIIEQDEQLSRLTAKAADVRKQLAVRTDPEKRKLQQAAALPPETAAQQAELRQNVQNVQTLLAQVEESMSLLRAELASIAATSAEVNGTATMPTVEAVTKTILKMTSMIERKSGDVDLLEAQIRKLPGGLGALGMSASYEDGLIDSLAGSRLSNGQTTPARGRYTGKADALGMSGMFGPRLGASTSSLRQSTTLDPTASFLGRSTSSLTGGSRRKMAEVTTDEISLWTSRATQRRTVLEALRRVVEKTGEPKIIRPIDA